MPARLHPHRPAPHQGPAGAGVRALTTPAPGLGLPLVVGVAALAGAVYLGVTDPYRPGGHLVCPLLTFTGLQCPACGAQRAVHDLVRLDLAGAWSMNALVVLGAPPALVAWLRSLWRRRPGRPRPPDPRVRGRRPPGAGAALRRAGRAALPWAVLVVVLGFGVLRNLPAGAALAP